MEKLCGELMIDSGANQELASMVYRNLSKEVEIKERALHTNTEEVYQKLNNLKFCYGVYLKDKCVCAFWGNDTTNMVIDKLFRGKVLTKSFIKNMVLFLVGKHGKIQARPLNRKTENMLMRCGFVCDGGLYTFGA